MCGKNEDIVEYFQEEKLRHVLANHNIDDDTIDCIVNEFFQDDDPRKEIDLTHS